MHGEGEVEVEVVDKVNCHLLQKGFGESVIRRKARRSPFPPTIIHTLTVLPVKRTSMQKVNGRSDNFGRKGSEIVALAARAVSSPYIMLQ